MKKLRTEGVAKLLGETNEGVRRMLRTKSVEWGVYIKPKKERFGRGEYVYYPLKFSEITGHPMEQVEAVMT